MIFDADLRRTYDSLPTVSFSEDAHRYEVAGRPLPSVTQVLREARMQDDRWWDTPDGIFARERGTAVHRMIEIDCEGVLDEAGLDPMLVPYLAQWRKFRETSGIRVLASELRLAHPEDGYAGTIDLAVILRDFFYILDFKTSATIAAATWVQLAGYSRLYYGAFASYPRLAAVHLDGEKYRLIERKPVEAMEDGRDWLAALRLYQWREKHYLI